MIEALGDSSFQLNDFVPLGKIGSGSFSQVLKVRNIDNAKIYALKKIKMKSLKPKQQEYAVNEIKILASLSSQYIISYRWSFFDQKTQQLCIVMEWANQGDLHAEIERRKKSGEGNIPESQIWRAAYDMIRGLAEIHNQRILHRDIKTANIFKSEGIYKIGDLNIAKICPNMIACTQTGTPYYASPEVWNQKPYDEKSDLWSLGCVIYEMCELSPPFLGANMQKLHYSITRGKYRPISTEYSSSLQRLINTCLKINPTQRLSCKQLLNCNWIIQSLKTHKIIPEMPKQQIGEIRSPMKRQFNSQNDLHNQSIENNKKYRIVMKNPHYGYRPQRNLRTSASKNKQYSQEERYYTNASNNNNSQNKIEPMKNGRGSAQKNTNRQSNSKNHRPGLVRNLPRPFSAQRLQNSKNNQRYRICKANYSKQNKSISQYTSLKNIKKQQPSNEIYLPTSHENNRYKHHRTEAHRQYQYQSLKKQNGQSLQEANNKNMDILNKLQSNERNRKKDTGKNGNESYQRPYSSKNIHSSGIIDKENNKKIENPKTYQKVTSKQQLRREIRKPYKVNLDNRFAIRPYSHHTLQSHKRIINSNGYMENILHKIRK